MFMSIEKNLFGGPGVVLHSWWDLISTSREQTQATAVRALDSTYWTVREFPEKV